MTGFMIGRQFLLRLVHRHRTAFVAHQHLVLGIVKIFRRHFVFVFARCQQCRLIDQIGQIGAGKSWRAAGNNRQVNVFGQRHLAGMYL